MAGYTVSSGASEKPVEIELSELEAGTKLKNNHVKIGEHYALVNYGVYEWEANDNEEEAKSTSKVNYAFYPIVSMKHPFVSELAPLLKKIEQGKVVTEADAPKLKNIKVLIKTDRFKTVGSYHNASIDVVKSIKGLVISEIESLDSEEEKLIKENIPGLDLENVYIIEENREPSSMTAAVGMLGGGVVLIVAGLFLVIVNRN